MKIDYRQAMTEKRKQNEQLKAEALKKAEEDGGKKGGKKDAKGGQPELKVNAFVESPSQKDKSIQILNQNGIAALTNFQLPDDFPPNKYTLSIESLTTKFGLLQPVKIELNVKAKQAAKKK